MGIYTAFFIKMTSLLWRHVYIERSQLVQHFANSFITCQVLNVIASLWLPEKWMRSAMKPVWMSQTSTFYFSTYCSNLFEHLLIHAGRTANERIDCCDRCISRQNNTSARSFFINNTFSPTSKLFTPNMYCWSCKTLVTIYWTYLRVNGIWATSFCPEKMNIAECCSLRDAFSGSVVIFIVDKWRHSDVIVIKLTAVIQN